MSRLSRVVPAILTGDPKTLKTMVEQAETFAAWVQFDIMDGRFVPSLSITSEHLAALAISFGWEAHLMVERPEEYIEGLFKARANKVVFHYEATSLPQKVISLVKGFGLKVGLALNPGTPVLSITPLASEIDSVLFLSVHPGFYGQSFLPEVLGKMRELRRLQPDLELGIDGGIKEGNIVQVAQAGADYICVGSAIFLDSNPAESFRHLQALAEEGSLER